MLRVLEKATVFVLACGLPFVAAEAASPFSGRWDLTIISSTGAYPSWIEFAEESGLPAIRMVGRSGSVYPVRDPLVTGSKLSFNDGSGHWEITIADHKLTGQSPDGQVSGVLAPQLNYRKYDGWSAPEPLFNGRDLSGWEPDNPLKNHWVAANGALENTASGANLRTARKFDDFKLHIEYNCPPGGNSGVYLRGRYEVQVEYEQASKNDVFHRMGSIYGFIPPAAEVEPRPGQWESYDVTLIGRTVTIIRDGVLIIDNATIPGITGGALDSHEAEPGPIYLQGDHSGGLKYRNIAVSLPHR